MAISVTVQNDDIVAALKQFKKKVKAAGLMEEIYARKEFKSKAEKRKAKCLNR